MVGMRAIAFACSLMAMLTMVGLLLWNLGSFSTDSSLTRILQTNQIRVGYAFEPPFSFANSTGEVTGESVEITKMVAKELGITKIVWVQMPFDTLISELQLGHIDMIASGMFITTDREHQIAFSSPTFRVQGGLLVRKDNPLKLQTLAELVENKRIKIAVISGAVEGEHLRDSGVEHDRIVIVPDASSGRAAVLSGLVDGLALSSATVRWMALEDPQKQLESLRIRDLYHRDYERGGLGMRKQDRQLREAVNAALAKIIGSDDHWQAIKSFGFSPDEVYSGR